MIRHARDPDAGAVAAPIHGAGRRAFAMMPPDRYVEPPFRRRGHARALMAALAAEALRRAARRGIGARRDGMFRGELIAGAALARLAETAR